jgi:hypothetical protein
MYKLIETILTQFKSCFKRNSTFECFVIIVIGMLLRRDFRGISSIVSTLRLEPKCYDNLIHFFRSKAFELSDLMAKWVDIVAQNAPLLKVAGRLVMIGDNIKIVKEAKKMPAVKKLHQDSENSGKSEYIYGHNHGIVGIVAQSNQQLTCIPLMAEIQDGMKQIKQMLPEDDSSLSEPEKDSIVVKMVRLAAKSVMCLQQKTFLVLDAYFASNVAFEEAAKVKDHLGNSLLTIIVRAKANFVAFEPAILPTNKRGRGRPAKYGKKVNLKELFESRPLDFQTAKVSLYGKLETIEYLCLDLLWRPLKGTIRFVLVKHGLTPFILMCSDLTVPALQIIELYGYRFKVEVMFKSLKNTIGSFFYHFWTAALPKFSRKTTEKDLRRITNLDDKAKIVSTAKAIEVFTFIGCIAMGILQLIALHYPAAVWNRFTGWLRTKTPGVTSVETVRASLQEEVLWNFRKLSKFSTLQLILSRQRQSLFLYDEDVSLCR